MRPWRNKLSLWIRENPYFAPLFVRVTVSLVVVLYLSLGASLFIVLNSAAEGGKMSTVAELRNRTAERIIVKLKELSSKPETMWSYAIVNHLATYDKIIMGVDTKECYEAGSESWTFSDAMLFSLVLLTTSGGYDYTKTSTAVKATIMIYICLGLPLIAWWLLLHGKTVAHTWLLVCVNSYRILAGLGKRFRTVSPSSADVEDDKQLDQPAVPQTLMTNLIRPEVSVIAGHLSYAQLIPTERNVRVVSVGTPQGTAIIVHQKPLAAAFVALCAFFLLYVIFGAGAMAASANSELTMFDALFWIFLQFTTTSSSPYATFGMGSGARGGWVLYYALGGIQLAALAYMAFTLITWRCAFSASPWNAPYSQA